MSDANEVDEVLFLAAAKADALRGAGLRGLQVAGRARQAGLEREHGRLSALLGATHPRTRAIAQRIKEGTTRLRDVTVEVARAETVAARAEPAEWILHGYVRYESLEPAADLTVALLDARGRWVEVLGFACTDARGYFRIAAAVGAVKPGVRGEAGAAAEPALPPEVHIRISDANRRQLYRGEDAIAVAAGRVEYREIVLGEGPAGCGPPQEEATGPQPGTPGKKPPPRARSPRRRKT